MKQIRFAAFLFVLITTVSCGKDNNGGPPSDTAAIITINAPVANSRFANGGPINVRGHIDDQDILKSATVEIKNKTSGVVLFTQTNLLNGIAVYSFDWTWNVTGVTATFTASIKIISTDQYNYQTTKEIDVTLDP